MEEEVYLPSSGYIPGLPGNHGPGWYLVDYVERTIRPRPLEQGVSLGQPEGASESHSSDNTGGSEEEESVASDEEVVTQVEEATPEQSMEVTASPEQSIDAHE